MDCQSSEQHTMEIAHEYPGGAQEWICPTCGRRVLIKWPPDYQQTVLTPGDENASHCGASGGLHMGQVNVEAQVSGGQSYEHLESFELDPIDEIYLEPWIDWLDEVDRF